MESQLMFIVFFVLLSIFVHDFLNRPVWVLCNTEKCPYCYGTDFCENIQLNKVTLTGELKDFFDNYISVKNVYKGIYRNKSVVLKKLARNIELDELDELICAENNLNADCVLSEVIDIQNYEEKVLLHLNSLPNHEKANHFRTCDNETSKIFVDKLVQINGMVVKELLMKNIWTSLQINIEPFILQMLKNQPAVPYLYGSCGRLIVVKNAGNTLNDFESSRWIDRAYLALQIMEAMETFTYKLDSLRLYLTDVSPDNIVVDSEMKVSFIDFENVILANKLEGNHTQHHSERFEGTEFLYDEDAICRSTLSDHNFYAVCKLLLSEKAPYPMMYGGLLHSPPPSIKQDFGELYEYIKLCEKPSNSVDRFDVGKLIIKTLKNIVNKSSFFV